jgi:hypothetical protein
MFDVSAAIFFCFVPLMIVSLLIVCRAIVALFMDEE